MSKITKFEDLSNDLILEIFEYFHALDIFMIFSHLNHRIKSLISKIPLYLVINKLHCHYHIKILSSYLTHYIDQITSISFHDELYDFPSVIDFFFNKYTFKNLQYCAFYSIHSSSTFENVMKKLEKLEKFQSFHIIQPNALPLPDTIKQNLTKTLLSHKSRQLKTINLLYPYNHPRLVTHIALNFILTKLHIIFHSSFATCPLFSLLPILRHYRALRVLIVITSPDKDANTYPPILPTLPDTYKNNPPISPSIKTFELSLRTQFYVDPLNFLLQCMPNLRQLIILISYTSSSSFLHDHFGAFNGQKWEELITKNVPNLDIFDITVLVSNLTERLDINTILKSYDYFLKKYKDWCLKIYRSTTDFSTQTQQVNLHGFRYSKQVRSYYIRQAQMYLKGFEVYSTASNDLQSSLPYTSFKNLLISMPVNLKQFDIHLSNYLFTNTSSLTIEINSSMLSFWEDMFDLLNIRRSIPEDEQKERADKIINLVDLNPITKLTILPKDDVSHLHFIKEILFASSNVTHLKIGNPLIFSPILYQNPLLIPLLNQLQSLHLLSEHRGFPLAHAPILVKYFPSIIHLELELYSIDECKLLLNFLLDGLSELKHLKIHFQKNRTIRDGQNIIDYVRERRQQAFPDKILNQSEVYVNISEAILNIYLSGCSICAMETVPI